MKELTCHRSHAAVRIINTHSVDSLRYRVQQRVHDTSSPPRHGASIRAGSVEVAAALDKIASRAEADDESNQIAEVVASIRVGHEDILASSRFNTALQCGAVTSLRHMHDADAKFPRDLNGVVRAAVVDDNNLRPDLRLGNHFLRSSDAIPKRLRFVQARYDDRQFGQRLRRRLEQPPPLNSGQFAACRCPRLCRCPRRTNVGWEFFGMSEVLP